MGAPRSARPNQASQPLSQVCPNTITTAETNGEVWLSWSNLGSDFFGVLKFSTQTEFRLRWREAKADDVSCWFIEIQPIVCDGSAKSSNTWWNDDNEKEVRFSVNWGRLKLPLVDGFASSSNWLAASVNWSGPESFSTTSFVILIRLRGAAVSLLSRVLAGRSLSLCQTASIVPCLDLVLQFSFLSLSPVRHFPSSP